MGDVTLPGHLKRLMELLAAGCSDQAKPTPYELNFGVTKPTRLRPAHAGFHSYKTAAPKVIRKC
jgi:hypothetical protein